MQNKNAYKQNLSFAGGVLNIILNSIYFILLLIFSISLFSKNVEVTELLNNRSIVMIIAMVIIFLLLLIANIIFTSLLLVTLTEKDTLFEQIKENLLNRIILNSILIVYYFIFNFIIGEIMFTTSMFFMSILILSTIFYLIDYKFEGKEDQ